MTTTTKTVRDMLNDIAGALAAADGWKITEPHYDFCAAQRGTHGVRYYRLACAVYSKLFGEWDEIDADHLEQPGPDALSAA